MDKATIEQRIVLLIMHVMAIDLKLIASWCLKLFFGRLIHTLAEMVAWLWPEQSWFAHCVSFTALCVRVLGTGSSMMY